MAFPALIQKIFDLRAALSEAQHENTLLCAAIASLSEANVRMSSRITELQLEKALLGHKEIATRLSGLEKADVEFTTAISGHAGESVRMSTRLTELELDGARSGVSRVDIAERVEELEITDNDLTCSQVDRGCELGNGMARFLQPKYA